MSFLVPLRESQGEVEKRFGAQNLMFLNRGRERETKKKPKISRQRHLPLPLLQP